MPVGAAMANAQNAFAPPMGTQPPPRTEQVPPTVPDVEQEEHQAVYALDAAAPFLLDGDAAHEQPLKFTDVLTEAEFKTRGLGENGEMIFAASSKGPGTTGAAFSRSHSAAQDFASWRSRASFEPVGGQNG